MLSLLGILVPISNCFQGIQPHEVPRDVPEPLTSKGICQNSRHYCFLVGSHLERSYEVNDYRSAEAPELAEANVGVIVSPVRLFPFSWEGRCIWVVSSLYPHGLTFLIILDATNSLPGPPLTEDNVLTALIKNNVTVGIGHQGFGEPAMMSGWAAQNMRWDTAWVRENFYLN